MAWEIAQLLSLRNDAPEITMEVLESLKGSNAEHPQLLGYFRSLRYNVAWEIAQLLSLQNDAPEITMEALESLKGSKLSQPLKPSRSSWARTTKTLMRLRPSRMLLLKRYLLR